MTEIMVQIACNPDVEGDLNDLQILTNVPLVGNGDDAKMICTPTANVGIKLCFYPYIASIYVHVIKPFSLSVTFQVAFCQETAVVESRKGVSRSEA